MITINEYNSNINGFHRWKTILGNTFKQSLNLLPCQTSIPFSIYDNLIALVVLKMPRDMFGCYSKCHQPALTYCCQKDSISTVVSWRKWKLETENKYQIGIIEKIPYLAY